MEKTKKYEIFKKHPSNRPIDPSNLRKIIASISSRNLLELRPILVNSEMEIIDGQHRLEAAKSLGIPVYYEVSKKPEATDMILLNAAQKRWRLEDYINFYAQQGNENYQKAISFCKENDLLVVDFFKLILSGGSVQQKVRNGEFLFSEGDLLEKRAKEKVWFIKTVQEFLYPRIIGPKGFMKSAAFRRSLFKLMQDSRFDFDLFMSKLENNISRIHSCTKISEYHEMFKSIYNYRNQDPLI